MLRKATQETQGLESEQDSPEVPTGGAKLAHKTQELSRIAQLILQVDSHINLDQEDGGEAAFELGRKRLAAQLGCTTEDLQEIVESYGEDWNAMVLEERVKHGINSAAMRDISWDRLEGAVLKKLIAVVDQNKVSSVAELLSIARAANQASRGNRPTGGSGKGDSMTNQVNVNFLPGDPQNGVLPAGNLGKIQLTLSNRIQRQLSGPVIDGEVAAEAPERSTRVLDSIEMLKLDEIQGAAEDTESK